VGVIADWTAKVDPWVERAIHLPGADLAWALWQRMLELEFIDRAVALAAKAFIALFPLLIVVSAFTSGSVRHVLMGALESKFGVRNPGLSVVSGAFANPEQTRNATGWAGLLLTFLYATSFTTALQRVYLRTWRRPSGASMPNHARGVAWLGGVFALGGLVGVMRALLFGHGVFSNLAVLPFLVLGWWATAWLLLRGEVRWRPLLVPAALVAVGMQVYTATASLWMPNTVAHNQAQFGFFGVALSLVSWFVGAGFILVIGNAVGPVLAEADGSVGRWVLGRAGTALTPGSAPSLPAPPQVRLIDAFGLRRSGGTA